MRKTPFVNKEHYHIYNRGVDKRDIFKDEEDVERFFQSMQEFNTVHPVGSLYENSFKKDKVKNQPAKLVEIVCYCLNPNHFHFVLEQVADNGISEFMKRLGGGYTWYFNNRHKRGGSLFQGRFKSVHISSNPYLLHLGSYVNLNNRVHKLGGPTAKFVKSSWDEYMGKYKGDKREICKKDMILEQFKNVEDYKRFAGESLKGILERRYDDAGDVSNLLLE